MRSRFRLAACLASVAFLPTASAGVLVVDAAGGPFTAIQPAVDAAQDGDTILVRAGPYAGFEVTGKGLSIVADPEGAVSVTGVVRVTSITAGQRVLLSGLAITHGGESALQATAVAGTLRVEAVTVTTTLTPAFGHAVWLVDCADAAFLRCTLTGAMPFQIGQAGAGLSAQDSRVALYDSALQGGPGYNGFFMGSGGSSVGPGSGGPGAAVSGASEIFVSGGSVRGGQGGLGVSALCFPAAIQGGAGASGGPGLVVQAEAWIVGAVVDGGPGGAGGNANPGCGAPAGPTGPTGPATSGNVITTLPGAARVLHAPTHAHEQTPIPLELAGTPGELVWLRIGPDPSWQLSIAQSGVQLFAPSARRALLGVVPGSGVLSTSIQFPDLGAGVEAQTWHLQPIFRDGSGQTRLGSGAVLVVLDSQF